MKLFVTIAEETAERAVEAIGAVKAEHDGIEIRVEKFSSYDPAAFRRATAKPVILTKRGAAQDPASVRQAIEAGIDFVDVEYRSGIEWITPLRSRVVLSHHDYNGMPADVHALLGEMRDWDCAHTKLAVTPRTFADNLALLRESARGTSLIGMGERGLYARILAPFIGSELAFVSLTADRAAAPGQLDLDRALKIYGHDRGGLRAEKFFAVAGNPAGHSMSPAIHNSLFREKRVRAAYTIASFESFDEVARALVDGMLSGLSITAPFKEDAFAFARMMGAEIGDNAIAAESVNTLVNTEGVLLADNTDVDGFGAILARLCGKDRKTVALIGAGGTARAALVALERAGMNVILYNRTESKGRALAAKNNVAFEPLANIRQFDGEIVVDTTPGGGPLGAPLRPGMTVIEAGYGYERGPRDQGVEWIGGLELLHAQAIRQHELFMKVFDGS